jgi:hypothetical protein
MPSVRMTMRPMMFSELPNIVACPTKSISPAWPWSRWEWLPCACPSAPPLELRQLNGKDLLPVIKIFALGMNFVRNSEQIPGWELISRVHSAESCLFRGIQDRCSSGSAFSL